MAATTWCRLRLCLTRLASSNLRQNTKFQTTLSSKSIVGNDVKDEYPEYEVSTEEFAHVERLLPKQIVPEPPKYTSYPTPSGWLPPKDVSETPNYFVQRTKNHMLPIYLQTSHGGSRKMVMIRKVEGDIWAFEADIRKYLEEKTSKKVPTQVHEVGRFIRVKGLLLDEVSDFLIENGF